ncbi:hypothetical protein BT96DRAFT_948263 [Gymnopus androsaceus JB14]|uniref:Uncharacterized protein n=1 Tax=Gymnopus androsaceus JB14 TaxID=1447944 RepID=A0A6A4GP83_9AGAR|nr:hypothetical protein BT96DRAFT_948263 [Gymnopus androsaceus JB14]
MTSFISLALTLALLKGLLQELMVRLTRGSMKRRANAYRKESMRGRWRRTYLSVDNLCDNAMADERWYNLRSESTKKQRTAESMSNSENMTGRELEPNDTMEAYYPDTVSAGNAGLSGNHAVLRLADLSMGVRSELAGIWTGEGVERSVVKHIATGALGNIPVKLPLRVQLGSQSLFLVKMQAQSTMEDVEQWAWISHLTNANDTDGENYVKQYPLEGLRFPYGKCELGRYKGW